MSYEVTIKNIETGEEVTLEGYQDCHITEQREVHPTRDLNGNIMSLTPGQTTCVITLTKR
jgi:hypothetical protein